MGFKHENVSGDQYPKKLGASLPDASQGGKLSSGLMS
jgi:hypothetical protein